MVAEYKSYQSEVFKIAGFALMTPLGRFVLNLIEIGVNNPINQLLINAFASFLLFLLGIMSIQRGFEIVEEI